MLFEEGTKKMFNTYALEQRIAAHMGAVSAPGAAVAVISGADVVYARGFGVTSVEDGAPVTPHTLFCIGSTTKALTATLIMRLVDAGTLDLDEPVTTYLPWFTFHKEPAAAGAVTLRCLLSFTAGLPAGGRDFGPPGDEEMERFVREVIQGYELVAPPGVVLLYSNTSLSLVGHIAEAVTGRSYRDLMRDLVFEPLAMRQSTFDRTVALTYPLALPHERDADGVLRVTHRLCDHAAGDPSGFALSTVLDLANFAIMQINGGSFAGQRVLSDGAVGEMQRPQADLHNAHGNAFGLTFFLPMYKGKRQVQRDGDIQSYHCMFTLYPEERVAIVAVTNDNAFDLEAVLHPIFDELLHLPEDTPPPRVIAPNTALWPDYTGSYLNPAWGLATIVLDGERLTLDLNGDRTPLDAVKDDLYYSPQAGWSVGFVRAEKGPAPHITIGQVGSQPFRRVVLDAAFSPDPAVCHRFVGRYEEFAGDPYPITVRMEDDTLMIDWMGESVPCIPLSGTSFVGAKGLFEFETAEDGSFPALRVWRNVLNRRVERDDE